MLSPANTEAQGDFGPASRSRILAGVPSQGRDRSNAVA